MPTWINNYADRETPIGAGFWAYRETTSACGRKYTKLVKRDRAPGRHVDITQVTMPLTGKRTDKLRNHRARSKKD